MSYKSGADQGFAAGMLTMGGINAASTGHPWLGLGVAIFGVLIYIEAQFVK